MKTIKREKSDLKLAMVLLFPSIFLVLLLVAYPMISNIQISFFDQPINQRLSATFVGIENYISILSDGAFFQSLGITLLYMIFAVAGSTALGLGVAIFFNRPFKFRKLSRSLIILSYVTPSISMVFAWK
mgnify:FL=1